MKSGIGPGLVFLLTVIGPGDVVSNATAGSTYGYSLLWALALTSALRYVWVSTSAKYVLVTGESLIEGYRRLGSWLVWTVAAAAVAARHLGNLTMIVIMGSSVDLLAPLPTRWSAEVWSLAFTGAGFAMMFWGGYPAVERACKWLTAAMAGALVAAAWMAHPEPEEILRGAVVPSVPHTQGVHSVLLVLAALVGTGTGSMTNLTYSQFIYEKGWRNLSFLSRQRWDLAVCIVCMFVLTALVQIAAAGTVRPLGIQLQTAEDLVRIFTQTQGLAGRVVFALGLWAAAFTTFVGATLGYGLMLRDLWGPKVYRWSIVFWSVSPLYILFTGVKPVRLALVVSALVVALIPILALALLRLVNDRERMGEHRVGWVTNAIMALLVAVSVYVTVRNVMEWW